jgi:hypothetical protein
MKTKLVGWQGTVDEQNRMGREVYVGRIATALGIRFSQVDKVTRRRKVDEMEFLAKEAEAGKLRFYMGVICKAKGRNTMTSQTVLDIPANYPKARITHKNKMDQYQCATPGCDCDSSIMVLVCADHPSDGTVVSYHKASGLLHVQCNTCLATVQVIRPAEEGPSNGN